MFAYDYLKENPQHRDKQLKYDWASLFNEAPFSVTQELRDIAKIIDKPTDAQLFWHKQLTIHNLLERKPKEIEHGWYTSHWCEQLYLCCREDDELIQAGFKFLCTLSLDILHRVHVIDKVLNDYLNYIFGSHSVNSAFVNAKILSNNDTAYNVLLHLIMGGRLTSLSYTGVNSALLLRICKTSFLATLNFDQLRQIDQLIHDTNTSSIVEFSSINQIQALHDEQAEQRIQEMLSTKSENEYYYTTAFVELCDNYGFILPKNEKQLAMRGMQHNNCVGNYALRHTTNGNPRLVRLLFTATATIELDIEIAHDKIVAVRVNQCKGRYNKDMPQTEALTELRIALTGSHKEVVDVVSRL